MTDTLFNLDDTGRVRHTDPATSVEAARKITGRTERELMAVFERGGDWTADELVRELGTVFPPTAKSAVSRLANHNLIKPTGETRLSDRGVPMLVYRIALSDASARPAPAVSQEKP